MFGLTFWVDKNHFIAKLVFLQSRAFIHLSLSERMEQSFTQF
jgi:hypothetical protein